MRKVTTEAAYFDVGEEVPAWLGVIDTMGGIQIKPEALPEGCSPTPSLAFTGLTLVCRSQIGWLIVAMGGGVYPIGLRIGNNITPLDILTQQNTGFRWATGGDNVQIVVASEIVLGMPHFTLDGSTIQSKSHELFAEFLRDKRNQKPDNMPPLPDDEEPA